MKNKRSLGQNFFINKNLSEYIVSTINTKDVDCIVEIGPGEGFFTEKLLSKKLPIVCIEKDDNLARLLHINYPDITIYNEDFLDFNLEKLNKNQNILFWGSLPYNISKKIITKIIKSHIFNKKSYFIIQKEVAEKYIYKKPYNILSLNTSIYANVKKILDINPESFRPKPKVNSSLICIEPNNRGISNNEELEKLILESFKYPRKNLKNNLSNTKYIEGLNEYLNKRPSELNIDEYIKILNRSLI